MITCLLQCLLTITSLRQTRWSSGTILSVCAILCSGYFPNLQSRKADRKPQQPLGSPANKKNVYECRSSAYAAAAGVMTLGCAPRPEPAGPRQRVLGRDAEEGTYPPRQAPRERPGRPGSGGELTAAPLLRPRSRPRPNWGRRQAEGQRRSPCPDPEGQRLLGGRKGMGRGDRGHSSAAREGAEACGRPSCFAERRAEEPGASPETKWFPPALARSRRPRPRTPPLAGPYRDIFPSSAP